MFMYLYYWKAIICNFIWWILYWVHWETWITMTQSKWNVQSKRVFSFLCTLHGQASIKILIWQIQNLNKVTQADKQLWSWWKSPVLTSSESLVCHVSHQKLSSCRRVEELLRTASVCFLCSMPIKITKCNILNFFRMTGLLLVVT